MQDQPKLILDDNSASNNFFYFELRLLPTIHKSIETPARISNPWPLSVYLMLLKACEAFTLKFRISSNSPIPSLKSPFHRPSLSYSVEPWRK